MVDAKKIEFEFKKYMDMYKGTSDAADDFSGTL